jgi:ferredoxin
MVKKVTVDKDACVACGACFDTCPEVFEADAEGKSQVKKKADLNAPCVEEAANGCPAEAIKVED